MDSWCKTVKKLQYPSTRAVVIKACRFARLPNLLAVCAIIRRHALPYRMERSLSARAHLVNIPDSHLDSAVTSPSRVTSDGLRLPRQVHSQLFHAPASRPSYKYDNTRGASSSHEITPFDTPLTPPPTLVRRPYASPSPLERRTCPYRPSCITRRRLSSMLYGIGNTKTRIKVPPLAVSSGNA